MRPRLSIGHGELGWTFARGLDMPVGELGAPPSRLGKRQLSSLLARAGPEPSIFILDEALPAIDPFTRSQIQDAIDLNFGALYIDPGLHRLSTREAQAQTA